MLVMGEGTHIWGQRYMRNLCTLSPFCCKPKSAVKKKNSFKKWLKAENEGHSLQGHNWHS